LKEAVEKEDYEQVAKLCPALLESTPDDAGDNVKAALYENVLQSPLISRNTKGGWLSAEETC
jgi:hypothetical protein